MITSLSDLPATAAYLKRVGAKGVNFRTATMTREIGGYPKVVGTVRFSKDGAVYATGEAEPPSEDEQGLIAAEFATNEFPKITALTAIGKPPPEIELGDPNVYLSHDFHGDIIMVSRRYETKNGGKGFIPWTFWSDGEWRMMEPDVTPFWGLPGYQDHSVLILHEGAKAARAVRQMLDGDRDASRFPWLEQMRYAHHVGWQGGVFAVNKSDWRKLASHKWDRVIIVADNDMRGRNVIPDIAKHFQCPTFSLEFDDRWDLNFDMANDFPEEMFSPAGQYIGPPFVECLKPATYATDRREIPPEGRGRPRVVHEIRPHFAEQWMWVEDQDIIVNTQMPMWRMPASRFDKFIRPFSTTPHTSALLQSFYTGAQMSVAYDPSSRGRLIKNHAGMPAINLYEPSRVRPIPGDWSPFNEFMEYLFPEDEDRHNVKRWIATLIARPEIRMVHGLLLMSEAQGIGKTTLAGICSELVGHHNCSFPGENLIVESQFNGWLAGKRLVVVNEIYSGHSWRAYNKLKSYVSDETFEVNIKMQATYVQQNWAHFFLCSNSLAALKLEKDDRRWQVPKVTELAWPRNKFVEFYAWLRSGGYAHIAHWAHSFEERGEGIYFGRGDIAPSSAAKRRLIEESRSDAEQMFINLADAIKDEKEPMAIPLAWVKDWAAERVGKVHETTQGIGRTFRSHGLFVTDRIKIRGMYHWLVVNKEEMTMWDNKRLRAVARRPIDMIQEEM